MTVPSAKNAAHEALDAYIEADPPTSFTTEPYEAETAMRTLITYALIARSEYLRLATQ